MQQLDARIYANSNQEYASSGIFNPRTRIYFEGNVTKSLSYEFSFQQTYATLNLLDSYLNYRFSDGFQLRLGRYKTPFTYEWYRVHIWHLLAPERSLFATNFEGNRRFGLMGHGSLLDNRLEYAVGSFDGQRNGYHELQQPPGRHGLPQLQAVRAADGFLPAESAGGRLGRRGHREQPPLAGGPDDLGATVAQPTHPRLRLRPVPGIRHQQRA